MQSYTNCPPHLSLQSICCSSPAKEKFHAPKIDPISPLPFLERCIPALLTSILLGEILKTKSRKPAGAREPLVWGNSVQRDG